MRTKSGSQGDHARFAAQLICWCEARFSGNAGSGAHGLPGRSGRRYFLLLSSGGLSQMARRLVSSGSTFEQDIGYSRAVVDGEWVFVAGTTGFDYATMTIPEGVVAQCEQAMRNVEHALEQAGASMADVVRVKYLLPRREDFEPCWPVLKRYFGNVRPAATMIQAGLSDARMLFEIEVTARRS
jgi:enamine deaminase RidA (YjgF/YER057c/UK114 family)